VKGGKNPVRSGFRSWLATFPLNQGEGGWRELEVRAWMGPKKDPPRRGEGKNFRFGEFVIGKKRGPVDHKESVGGDPMLTQRVGPRRIDFLVGDARRVLTYAIE